MLQVEILNLNTDHINLIVVFLIICDISPAPAKALPLSSTKMHSMLGMLNLQGGQFKPSFQELNWDNFRGYRLTTNYIEPISFTVPRVKSTFFQVQFLFQKKNSCASLTKFDKNLKNTSLKSGKTFRTTCSLQRECSGNPRALGLVGWQGNSVLHSG